MKVLVLGGSGGVGQHVVRGAVARGWDVVAVVRPSTTFDAPASVRVIRGEVLDPAVWPDALAGRDAVLSSIGVKRRSVANPYSALVSPADLCSRSAALLCDEMVRAGVHRVIAVSAAGVADSAPRMNAVMRFLVATSSIGAGYRDLARMEEVYAAWGRADGNRWLCLRPVTLTNGPETGRVREVDSFGMTMHISRADVANYALDAAERGWTCGPTPQIAGD